jgi:hypothetical protein
MADTAFTVTSTIAMILVAATMDRFQSAANGRSITSMPMRRATDKVMLEMPAMMVVTSTALDLKGDEAEEGGARDCMDGFPEAAGFLTQGNTNVEVGEPVLTVKAYAFRPGIESSIASEAHARTRCE